MQLDDRAGTRPGKRTQRDDRGARTTPVRRITVGENGEIAVLGGLVEPDVLPKTNVGSVGDERGPEQRRPPTGRTDDRQLREAQIASELGWALPADFEMTIRMDPELTALLQ